MRPCLILLSLFSFCLHLFSQTNQWTWIGGSSSSGQSARYGTRGVASPTNQPGSRYGAVTFKDPSGKFWLYGGEKHNSIQQTYSDLWMFDPVTNLWTWMNGATAFNIRQESDTIGVASPRNQPGGRLFATSWSDATGNLWLFGGAEGGSNHLWKYSISTGLWTWVHGSESGEAVYGIKGVPDPANVPKREYGSIGWIDMQGNLWLFGGINADNTLWKYDPSINQWAWMSGYGPSTGVPKYFFGTQGQPGSTNIPPQRLYGSGWRDPAGNLWLFGGYGSLGQTNGDKNDLWKYSPSTGWWTWMNGDSVLNKPRTYGVKGVASASNNPGAREGAVTWTDASGDLWLFGGALGGAPALFFNDLWKYSPSTNQWTWMSGDNTPDTYGVYGTMGVASPYNTPSARIYSAGWNDASGRLWLYGGFYKGAADFNDLWQYSIPNTSLPLKFTSFTARQQQEAILLNWNTVRDQNSLPFVVERSSDGSYGRSMKVKVFRVINRIVRFFIMHSLLFNLCLSWFLYTHTFM